MRVIRAACFDGDDPLANLEEARCPLSRDHVEQPQAEPMGDVWRPLLGEVNTATKRILRSNRPYPHGELNPGYHLERVVS